jgi:hypothetical protein
MRNVRFVNMPGKLPCRAPMVSYRQYGGPEDDFGQKQDTGQML